MPLRVNNAYRFVSLLPMYRSEPSDDNAPELSTKSVAPNFHLTVPSDCDSAYT